MNLDLSSYLIPFLMISAKMILPGLYCTIAVGLASTGIFNVSEKNGPHGGIVNDAGAYKIEMKNSRPDFYAFLLDKKSKPVSNKGITCEVKFFFPDSTAVVAPLIPYEQDGFKTKSEISMFSSCRITFDLSGKKVSSKFENEEMILVEKKGN